MQVRRDAPLPIATQIAEQLIALIRSGRLSAGERLPPVRVLAGFLRVNRNTVAKVYATLERTGYLATTQGRGTFVATLPPRRGGDTLAPLVDQLLDAAAAHGIGEGELHALIVGRAAQRARGTRPRVGFVECNASDLAYFARQLASRLRVPLVPVLLADLRRASSAVDLVATTMFHVEEVRRLLPRREVVGLMAMPELPTLEAVAQLPSGVKVALVCATEEGVRSKERSIHAVGIQRPRLMTATLQQAGKLADVLRRADVVLASPKVLERIREAIPPKARVIPFASVLSDGAVALLEERIRAWRPARHTAGDGALPGQRGRRRVGPRR
jgi:DNA-binding transcriptional regulator YhcF (GntR family)